MIENTISIDSMTVDTAESDLFAEETAENSNSTAQGNDWQNFEEKESDKVQGDAAPDGEETAETEGEKVKLTVYGEEVEVSFEEAKAAAQRGIAFERIKGQLATAKNNVHLKALEDIARTKGTTLARFVGDIVYSEEKSRLEKEFGSLNQVPTEILGETVEKMNRIRAELSENQLAVRADDWSSQLMEYMEDNPGGKEIPPEVIETAKQTGSLALAYSDYNARQLAAELDRTKAELEMLKAEKQTSKGTPPSAQSVAAAGEGEDDSFRKMMRSTW